MTRILSGTATVVAGDRTVAFFGPPLSDANCPVDGSVVLAGAAYFIASRTDTSHFELTRDYEGADGTVSCEIDPLNANAINLVKVARQITEYNAKLALTDAYGKGLFYECLGLTGANDPGPGRLARNAAAWSDTTEIYMDVLDAGGHEQGALIDLARAGTAYIVRAIDTGAYAAFILSAAPVNVGPDEWRKISLEYVDGDGIIADGELVAVEWNRKGEQGDSFTADAEVDTLAERDAFDDEAAGFVLKVNDVGDGRTAFYTMGTGGTADWGAPAYLTGSEGDKGDQGDRGWSPQLVAEADGERRVMKLAGYVGGAGDPPTANVGEYLKADGTFTADIADAMDIRGAPGVNGAGTVAGIGEGAGIAVDSADLTNPVVALANMPQATLKGRASGAGTGVPADLSATEAMLVVMANGQLKFPATQMPSSDANTLDDYEEGTYTPTWTNGGPIGNGVLKGAYTKIGDLVSASVYLLGGSTTTWGGSGSIWSFSLPFSTTDVGAAAMAYALDSGTAHFNGAAVASSTASSFSISSNASGSTWTSAVPFTWTTNDRLQVSFTYKTTA